MDHIELEIVMGIADELEKLEQLRTRGTLSEDEFALAKAQLLSPPPAIGKENPLANVEEQVRNLQVQNQLARLDREWELEERRYQLRGSYGAKFTPTMTMALMLAVSGTLFGSLWIAAAFFLPSVLEAVWPLPLQFPTVTWSLYAIGALIALGSVYRGCLLGFKAVAYRHAYRQYRQQRKQIEDRLM